MRHVLFPAKHSADNLSTSRSGEERPRAYVVLAPGEKVTPQEIATWIAGMVAPHKQLRGGIVVVDAIPKNPSGKILRKILRERAKEEVGDSAAKQSRL